MQRLLADGVAALALDVSQTQQQQLLTYVALLAKWNAAYNLTAVREPADMVTKHVLDSLTILPFVDAGELLDVGTGAGLPGLVLAICRPAQRFVLLDSNGKKTRFVKQATLELRLNNVDVVQQRAEQYRGSFPQLCCRAFAALPAILASCGHLLARDGRLLAMKVSSATEEEITPGWQREIHNLTVPGLQESLQEMRQLWVLTRKGEST